MTTAAKPPVALTAADLMSPDPVVIKDRVSMRAAARVLSQGQISGAPVVDTEGRSVGILSSTDVVRWTEQQEQLLIPSRRPVPWWLSVGRMARRLASRVCTRSGPPASSSCEPSVVLSWSVPDGRVSDYMTPDPVTAEPSTPIARLARLMLDARIHRLVVLDAARRPVGIVSSTDLVAALAHLDEDAEAAG